MASVCRIRYLTNNLLKLVNSRICAVPPSEFIPVRHAIYSPDYLKPTLSKAELDIPLEEGDERRFHKIKAAQSEQTTSIFYDPLVEKLINMIMKGGNKQVARNILNLTFENIKHIQVRKRNKPETSTEYIECDPVQILYHAIENCTPILMTTVIPKGGVSYEVPIACMPKHGRFMAMRWMLQSCREREDRKQLLHDRLANELLAAFHNQGMTVKKKQDLHKLCEANKAYAHFRWT